MKKFDVAVVGGGPAGYMAAERLGDAGKRVLLVERRALGGVCLNEGCIPTKALLYSSKICKYAAGSAEARGVSLSGTKLEHSKVLSYKNEVVKMLVNGIASGLKKRGVSFVAEQAVIKKTDEGFVVACGADEFAAENIILATGSRPLIPPIDGVMESLKRGKTITSRELLDIAEIPKSLVVVGGGVVGLEMAAYFNAAGSKVVIVEALGKIGGAIDKEASDVLKKIFEEAGVVFHLQSKVTRIAGNTAFIEKEGKTLELTFEKLLLSVGRKPAVENCGLEKLGLYMDRGAVVTDDMCSTNIPGLYAAGDVNGKYMLAHTAYREAEVAVNNILGIKDMMDYTAIPGVIYTQPEVAFVGLTEERAKWLGVNSVVKKASINMSGRHVAECGISEGFVKVVLDIDKNIIIGATLVSAYASEVIYALALMIQNKIPIDNIKRTVFPHPTVCEVIREVLF